MKTKLTFTLTWHAALLLPLLLSTINYQPSAFAQGTAFTYQGRLNDNATPASGIYDLRFTIYDSTNNPGVVIAGPLTNAAAGVSNGLFTVTLDFGNGVFTGPPRWLEIGVRTNGPGSFSPLAPRQLLTPAPYALYAPNAGAAASAASVSANAVDTSGLQSSAVTSDKIADGAITAADVNSASFSNTFWKVDGNAGTTPGTHFLGTPDDQPLELRVNNQRAMRLAPTASNDTVNVVAGSSLNYVGPGLIAVTIAGGGTPLMFGEARSNSVGSDFATVGGGIDNQIGFGSPSAVIGGGFHHRIGDGSSDATIGGGAHHVIGSNSVSSVVGGGFGNRIGNFNHDGTISGGSFNEIGSNTWFATVAGGSQHHIGTNSSSAVIAGGYNNDIGGGSLDATIGGGTDNVIATNSWRAGIGGGYRNVAGAPEATVAGGAFNQALGFSATVGGGGANIASGAWSTIAGGRNHVLTNADYATIGGGQNHVVEPQAHGATIAGGLNNVIEADADYAVVAGGHDNRIKFNAEGSFLGGGVFNVIEANAQGTYLGGGFMNSMGVEAYNAVLGGGNQNRIGDFAREAVIGGGFSNRVGAPHAVIPGGELNAATGRYSFAAGRNANALHEGAFVWADAQSGAFASTGNNQFNVRAGGGVRFETGGAGLTLDGAPVLAGTVSAANVDAASFSNTFWKVDGNAGTVFGTHFVGTTDYRPLDFRVNNQRALHLDANNSDSPNVVGGHADNHSTSLGAFIGGGGLAGQPNRITSEYSAIVGGRGNTNSGFFSIIGGGTGNVIESPAQWAGIAGGQQNRIGGLANHAAIGAGRQNEIQSDANLSVIGGGFVNVILTNAERSVIGGGDSNTNGGNWAVIPGGRANLAAGNYSFAAGRRGKANHAGAFVWADSQDADFASITNNQFLIRAAGGVGINGTNTPHALTVGAAETPLNTGSQLGVHDAAQAFIVTRQTAANVEATFGVDNLRGVLAVLSDHPLVFRAGNGAGGGNVEYMRINTNGFVGIGLTNPTNRLHVAGGVSATAFVSTSDRNAKEDFAPVSPAEVLAKVAALPITRWRFKELRDGLHLGPMAQDFYAAFGLGGSETTITTVDADGVALAAIQGLNRKVEDLNSELKRRDAESAELKRELQELKRLVRNLAPQLNRGVP